ncbi:MAG: trypsin-like peptidase domain-containing protein [Phycisphaerales bacterium JB039]
MRKFVSFGPALAAMTAALVALLVAPALVRRMTDAHTEAQVVLARQSLDDDDILERINRATRSIAQSVEPSVVHLMAQRRWGSSSGSGWIYDDAGHIVTNAHVVGSFDQMGVQFSNGRLGQADVIGVDVYTDIAVLRVDDPSGIVPARRATGDRMAQGDRVFAFGSPFGFKFSMSEGIVSGLGRSPRVGLSSGGFTNFIQTDAAVNPGNSGGPLVDVRGRVVGMNVAIATGRNGNGEPQDQFEGQSAGISFAIPLATIESVVDQMIARGEIARGMIGIVMDDMERREFAVAGEGDDVRMGVRVAVVASNGPAEVAGIRPGDVITEIGNQPTPNNAALRSVVTAMRPGEPVDVSVWRDGAWEQLEVTLTEFPPEELRRSMVEATLAERGMRLIETRSDPVVVGRLDPSSPLYAAGFRSGAVILKVDDEPVGSIDEFAAALEEARLFRGRGVPVTISLRSTEADGEPEQRTIRLSLR